MFNPFVDADRTAIAALAAPVGPVNTGVAVINPLNGIPTGLGGTGLDANGNPLLGDTPLFDFAKIWDTPIGADGKPLPPPPSGSYLPEIPADQLSKMFTQLDFTKSMKPETLNAIAAGGEQAVAAMKELINNLGQQVSMVSFKASNGMVERGLAAAKDRFTGEVPGHVNEILVDNALTQEFPIFSKPAYAPMIKSIRAQLQTSNPMATPAQIEGGVREYFHKMATDLGATMPAAPKPGNNSQSTRKIITDDSGDWEAWGGLTPPAGM